jgi:hypothetical protein
MDAIIIPIPILCLSSFDMHSAGVHLGVANLMDSFPDAMDGLTELAGCHEVPWAMQ